MSQINPSLKVACPNCSKKVTYSGNPNRPFCSERCRLIDLGEWASESYRVAASDDPFTAEIEKGLIDQDTNDFGES